MWHVVVLEARQTMLKLTPQNYYSPEANWDYFSVSQVKSFMECPARTMAELNGEYERPVTSALLIGSYVDAYFEDTLDVFREEHPKIFRRDGMLKAEYAHADYMIQRAMADKIFMEHMDGDKQAIFTGEIDGYPFKVKLDVHHPDRIVDLKTTKNFKPVYMPGQGRMNFIEAYHYTLQGGVYQAIEAQNRPSYKKILGNLPLRKPFYIAAITKENTPDIAVVQVGQEYMDAEMKLLRQNLPYYDAIKQGMIEPPRCEHCEYCKLTRKLTGPITLDEFDMTFFEGEEI